MKRPAYTLVRRISFILFCLILYSCQNGVDGGSASNNPQNADTSNKPTIPDSAGITKGNEKETNEEESDEDRIDTALRWIAAMYRDSSIYIKSRFYLIYFKQLNDSISYCIYQHSGPNCLMTYVATQLYRKNLANEEVAEGCDTDLSAPSDESSEYEHDSTQYLITTIEASEKAKKKYLTKDGYLKEGYTRENVELIKDTIITKRKIEPSGKITSRRVDKL